MSTVVQENPCKEAKRVAGNSEIIIIGGGSRGLFFTQILTQQLGRKVAAIADNYEPGHKAIRHRLEEFGTPDTELYSSADELLAAVPRSRANIAFVMTPEWAHLDAFRKAINAGCHVFLEKPLATTKDDVLEIQRLAESTDKVVQVGFVLRYSAFYKKVKEILDSGVLGKIVSIQMNERLALQHGAQFKRTWHRKLKYTGGFINEKCSHDLDLMCWFKEDQAAPKQVYSYGGRHFCPSHETPEFCTDCKLDNCPWRAKGVGSWKVIDGKEYMDSTSSGIGHCVFHSDADITDHQCVQVIFDDGTQGTFTAISMSGDPGRDITIHGTDGYLEGNMEQGRLRVRDYWKAEMENVDLGTTDGHGGGDENIVRGFLESAELGLKPLATVYAGVRASLIAFAADESNAAHSVVQLDFNL